MTAKTFARALLIFAASFTCSTNGAAAVSDDGLLQRAITRMGGHERLGSVKNIHLKALGHRYAMEQSERPEAPFLIEYQRIEEWRDHEHQQWRQSLSLSYPSLPPFSEDVIVRDGVGVRTSGNNISPAGGQQLEDAAEALALGPEKLLMTAEGSPDLHQLASVELQGSMQTVFEFTWNKRPIRLYLNFVTELPTAIEWTDDRRFDTFWGVWGDCTTRVFYSFWSMQAGLRVPLQLDIYKNGMLERNIEISDFQVNERVGSQTFDISPENLRAAKDHPPVSIQDRKPQSAKEIANGILLFPGAWNVAAVKQEDGVVVIEAPISSGYSGKILEAVQKSFPDTHIKAVITTSDSWPHIGGLREYVARGVPIYLLDKNAGIVSRLIASKHTFLPDLLERRPRKATFRPIKQKVIIGSGPNQIEIIPIRGETTERQMVIFLPYLKMLYVSDAFQRGQDGALFTRQTFSEVADVVNRERLQVDKFWAMHMDVTGWSTVKEGFDSPQK